MQRLFKHLVQFGPSSSILEKSQCFPHVVSVSFNPLDKSNIIRPVDHENDKLGFRDTNDDDENVKDDDDDFADLNKSIGKGNMMVEFFSAEIEFNVCRYRSW